MRHDMKKLLCERPRIGSSSPSLKTGKRLNPNLDYDSGDYDWGPTCLPISRSRQFGYESKTLNENLNPLERFLRTAIGRAWDEVYSEIRENITPKKAIDFHVLFHLDFMVELHVEMFNGIPYHKKHSRWGRYEVTGLYVHPDTGILCLHERVQQDPAYTPKDALHWYGNFWFKKTIIKKTHCCTSTNSIIGCRNRKWINGKFVEFPYDTKEYCHHGLVAQEYPLWYVVEYGYHSPDEVYEVIRYGDWLAAQIGLKEGEKQIRYYRDVPEKLKEAFEVRRKTANKKELRLIRHLI